MNPSVRCRLAYNMCNLYRHYFETHDIVEIITRDRVYSSIVVISILKCVFVERDCETETRGRRARGRGRRGRESDGNRVAGGRERGWGPRRLAWVPRPKRLRDSRPRRSGERSNEQTNAREWLRVREAGDSAHRDAVSR